MKKLWGNLYKAFHCSLICKIHIFLLCSICPVFFSHAQSSAHHASTHEDSEQKQPHEPLRIDVERLQSIGVKFEESKIRPLDKVVRTVGRIETDEKYVAHVNVKVQGWIEDLYINTTGQKIKKGDLLFTLYSPDLVATQQEYLLAYKASQKYRESRINEEVQRTLGATHERLRLWGIEDSHIKDLETKEEILRALPFHAPLSGTVINKVAVKGMSVNQGQELYTIVDLSKVWILADIYEYELPLIQIGQLAKVSLSYDPQAQLEGKIDFIYPTVEPQTRTGKVRLEIDNSAENLKPGMFANIELVIPLGNRLVVPRDAVLDTGTRQVIFIHLGEGKLEWRTVKVGIRSGDWIEILEGLKEGEHIVTAANFLIDSESQLKSAFGNMMHGMSH